MTITEKIIKLYTFDSLPTDAAKETARDWWRGLIDASDFEFTIDDAKTIAELFGFNIDRVVWSGFCSQGDGACAVGSYEYKKGALKAVKQHAPEDETLHAIVERLQDIQRRNFFQLSAITISCGFYNYLNANVTQHTPHGERYDIAADTIDDLTEILRDFSAWIYKRLDAENDYLNSDEVIEDTLLANEYTFNEGGDRENGGEK